MQSRPPLSLIFFMNDAKHFKKLRLEDLAVQLSDPKKQKSALKKVIANMTIGSDLSSLFSLVIQCLEGANTLKTRQLAYTYLQQYAKSSHDLLLQAKSILIRVFFILLFRM